MPVEELEDLDGHLAAIVKPVAKLGSREHTRWRYGRHVDGDARHVLHHPPREEVVLGNLLDVAAPGALAHETAHEPFLERQSLGDVAHPRWPVRLDPETRQHARPDPFLLGGESHLVTRPPHPRAVER